MDGKKRSTYERILDAAEKLFAEQGYEGTSTREIVKAANASLSSFHLLFRSKENLCHEVLSRVMERHRQMLLPVFTRACHLHEQGLLRGEAAWDIWAETVRTYVDWAFLPTNRHAILLLARDMLDINSKIKTPPYALELTDMIQMVCRDYTGDPDARWARPIGLLLLNTVFTFVNYPVTMTKMLGSDILASENVSETREQVSRYLLLTLRAWLDDHKKAVQDLL